ncbi:MAG: TonB-dependent receptor [Rhodospirillaceae bacterium]
MNLFRRSSLAPSVFAACSFLFSASALAQRANENVVASAEDAFGTSIGNESIGLYGAMEARGFSPKEAGNMRIQGLYYDQQGNFGYTNQVASSTSIRVGLSAQSYPFPAPTGIADIRLRLPGQRLVRSFSAHAGPYTSFGAQADLDIPRGRGNLGAVLSVAAAQKDMDFHSIFYYVDVAGTLYWTPNDLTEVIGFYNRSHAWDGEAPPPIFTAGDFLPPKIDRSFLAGPDFKQDRERIQGNFGVIARNAAIENWILQAGVFRSTNLLNGDFNMLYRNTQRDGSSILSIRSRPSPWSASWSGEVRASGVFPEGPRRHTLHFAARGRAGERLFGGEDTVLHGPATIGVRFSVPKPAFNFGPQSDDQIRHGTVGVSYVGLWNGVGEISGGVQKAVYRRTVDYPARSATTRTSPWLYNGTLALSATDDLTFYAGYTRGLEDSGIAPESAANPGEALAASITKQVDGGFRYRIWPGSTLVAGVFEVAKPYFDRDAANLFTSVGALTHRGVEVSLSSEPIEGLKVVAGTVLLQARVSGFTVDQGLIAEVPPGRPGTLIRLNANYGPKAWNGFSLSAQVNYESAHWANRLNTFKIDAATVVDVGARYSFPLYGARATVRLDVQNLTNSYIWQVNSASGHFSPSPARRFILRLAADL